MITRPELVDARQQALAADQVFSASLKRQFGAAAGDRRYDVKRTGWDAQTIAAADAYREAADRAHRIWLTTL